MLVWQLWSLWGMKDEWVRLSHKSCWKLGEEPCAAARASRSHPPGFLLHQPLPSSRGERVCFLTFQPGDSQAASCNACSSQHGLRCICSCSGWLIHGCTQALLQWPRALSEGPDLCQGFLCFVLFFKCISQWGITPLSCQHKKGLLVCIHSRQSGFLVLSLLFWSSSAAWGWSPEL